MSEGYGATALPTASAGSPVRVSVDTGQLMQSTTPQQPQATQLAVFDAAAYEDCIAGKRIDANQHLVVYVVKNGLIRVLHRHTGMKTLLRAHKDQRVTDIQFFQEGDVLATVGGPTLEQQENGIPAASTVVVWRVFERSPEITNEMLLEIRSTKFSISRVIWHPFNPNQFWMIHTNEEGRAVATLVDTTKITTQRNEMGSHPVCECADFLVTPDAIQVKSTAGDLTDLCWNTRDSRHVLTTHSSGEIILWDTSQVSPGPNGSLVPQRLVTVMDTSPVSRAFFLPHEHVTSPSGGGSPPASSDCWTTCFATGSQDNRVITLWSPFGIDGSAPQRAQVIELQQEVPSSCLVDIVYGQAPPNAAPLSSFIVVSDRSQGNVWAFHCRAEWDQSGPQQRCLLTGADYVVPFKTILPIYSWSVTVSPTTDITEEELQEQGGLIFDTKIYAFQSKFVQCLTLTSYMCLPPESTWTDPTPGVTVERMFPVHSAHVSEVGSDAGDDFDDALKYDEEYDLMDDGADDDFDDAPDPSSLPPPPGIVSNGGGTTGLLGGNLMPGNSFSNWLGAIAGAPPAAPIPAEPTAPPASALPKPMPLPVPPTPPALLSPAELTAPPAVTPKLVVSNSKKSSSKSKDKKSPASKAPSTEGIKILKRAAETPTYPPAPLPTAPVPTSLPVPPLPAATVGTDDGGVRQIVRQELLSMVPELSLAIQTALVPSLQRSIQTSASPGASLDQAALVSGVIGSLEEPLRDAFARNMKAVLIPCMESITGQVLSQVSKSLDTLEANSKQAENKELQAMAIHLAKLTSAMEKMSQEVRVLRSSVAMQQQQPTSVAAPPAPSPGKADAEALKAEIKALLVEKKFEEAFTRAVSVGSVPITVFCCTNADISEVLGGDEFQLSQTILLCLLQQLVTLIALPKQSDLEVALLWLPDIAVSLDTEDEQIQKYCPPILVQLETLINERMARNDPALKRPLQRLLSIFRGIRT